jgi:ABC-type Mn2+/Zn2+ transport system ATPase subunit
VRVPARVSSLPVKDPAVIELRGVRAGYDGRTVIENVNLTVRRGELVALVGANGAGKSTLLKVIVGLLRPYEGSVSVLGSAPGASARRLAYLPQAETVHWDYPLRVEDVVLMGRVAHAAPGRGPSATDRDAARTALGRVQADDLSRRPIQALSGGQRQRILLARTLASDPELLLLDEPATGVDPATEEQLMSLLGDLASHGRTVLVSTHDLASVMAHFPRVLAMNGGIVADGDASILRDDAILRRTYGGHRPGGPQHIADEHHA